MRGHLRLFIAAAACVCSAICAVPPAHAASQPPPPARCGAPVAPGPLVQPPQIEASSLPLNDLGVHELILGVARAGDRFCYRYALDGVEQNAAPILRVHRGERFAVRIANEISAPAAGTNAAASALTQCLPATMTMPKTTAFVGYLNHTMYASYAPMPDTDVNLHLHGFEGPPEQENIFLLTLSTPAHACEYDVTIPRTQPLGTYFYHPHAHGMADDEVAGGLGGMWIVEPDAPQIPLADEHAVILYYRIPFVNDGTPGPPIDLLSTTAAAHQAALQPLPVARYDPFNPPPWPLPFPDRVGVQAVDLHGCGSAPSPLISLNGVDAPATITVPASRPQLLRILNATSDSIKYLRLADADGHVQTLKVVGRDGIPVSSDNANALAHYVPMDGILLVPTGRADVLLTLEPGQVLALYSDRRCIGPLDGDLIKHDLLTIRAGPESSGSAAIASTPVTPGESPAAGLLRFARTHPKLVKRRAITYTEYALPNSKGNHNHAEFYITETSNVNFHEQPFLPVFAKGELTPQANIVVKRGTIEEWYLFNATLEAHTFHIHQMAFAAEDEAPAPVMLDTVLVPVGATLPNKAEPNYPLVKPSRTRILLDFRNVPRGTFVFHCHMLFHEDGGMMGVIRVV